VSLVWSFVLHVAASTTDPSNNEHGVFWGEAAAPWTFDGSGNIAPPTSNATFSWLPTTAGASGAAAWSAMGLTREDTWGDLANEVLPHLTYTASS
jgi:hypothetical protein